MERNEYRDFLITNIRPWAKSVSGGDEVNCRCFYCQDSKDRNHGHFYIKIPKNDDPSVYYCQKCHTTGIVTHSKLLEWNIYDPQIALSLTEYNKQVLSKEKNRKFRGSEIYRITNNFITDDKLSQYKLKYLNHRLGCSLTFKDCIQEKIILNLNDLFKQNRLEYTRHPNIISQLDSNFIGFLSFDNAFLNLRNLNIGEVYQGINKRYVNYSLFGKYDTSTKYYILPNEIDLMNPLPVKLHIAEGPFDILSIYHNCRKEMGRNIYASIGGSGYKGIIRYFIAVMGLFNIEIHIYADNDIDRYVISDIAELLKVYGYHLYLHRNQYPGEKDFGVHVSKIRESVEKLI